jgi:hypothetical protein
MLDLVACRNVVSSSPSSEGAGVQRVSTFLVTLFLGDINTGTWPSRLGESQMRQ